LTISFIRRAGSKMEKIFLIYELKFPSGKSYIGQTCRPLSVRMRAHSIAQTAVGAAIRKYGQDNVLVEILESGLTLEQANEKETAFIAGRNTLSPGGYNVALGGRQPPPRTGVLVTPETRAKISAANHGKVRSLALRRHLSIIQTGRTQSPEWVAKRVAARRATRERKVVLLLSPEEKEGIVCSTL